VSAPFCAPFPLVLAGPSGGGKTTVSRRLGEHHEDVHFSVSATTRARRAGELHGEDYLFLSREEFDRMVREDEFLEWATVHGERYGTPRANLEGARAEGAHLILDVDVQGARSIRRRAPDAVTVFLLPPSGEEIVRRLRGRGSEDEEAVRRRLASAATEFEALQEFDYVVVNDELEETVRRVESILTAERCRVSKCAGLERHALELKREISRVLGNGAPEEGSIR